MAKVHKMTVNQDEKCKQCGKGGAVKTDAMDEYGICMECAAQNLKDTGEMQRFQIDIRYEEAPSHLYGLMNEIIQEHFQYLQDAKILIIMDTKKKMSNKKLSLGYMRKTNDMLRYLSIEPNELLSGYDYIMRLDKAAATLATPEYLEKLMRHELRHCEYNEEKEKPWGIRPHDIEDFSEEIELNKDDPHWGYKLAMQVEGHYQLEAKNKPKKSKQKQLFN